MTQAFKPGNKGRPKGAKSKLPPAQLRAKLCALYADDYISVLGKFATSRFKTDQKYFLSHMRRLLPREFQMTGAGGSPLRIVVHKATGEEGDESS